MSQFSAPLLHFNGLIEEIVFEGAPLVIAPFRVEVQALGSLYVTLGYQRVTPRNDIKTQVSWQWQVQYIVIASSSLFDRAKVLDVAYLIVEKVVCADKPIIEGDRRASEVRLIDVSVDNPSDVRFLEAEITFFVSE